MRIKYCILDKKQPPFETQDVKTTYRRIKANQYSFPDHAPIPESAKQLITTILQSDPAKRPSLDEILAHPFINNGGTIPKLLHVQFLIALPNANYIKQYAPSATNLKANQQSMQIGTEVFSSRKEGLIKSQTTTNMMKGLDQNPNNYYPEDKKLTQGNPSNQFMSSANLQQNKNTNQQIQGGDFSKTDQRPGTSTGQQQQQMQKQQSQNQDQIRGAVQQQNKYQSVQNLMSMNKTEGFNPSAQTNAVDQANTNTQDEVRQIDGSKNNLWVVQYVDYSSKYGLGYLLSNGSSGVVFNDMTKIILDPKAEYFEYTFKKDQDELTEKHVLSDYPSELQKKVTLLQHFRHYLMTEVNKKICADNSNNPISNEQQVTMQGGQALPYLKKWMQTRHAIMFRLSNKIVQVQFSDKTEILLNSIDKIVSFMNKKSERFHYPLADAMNSTNTDMTKRLRYTKEILTHLLRNNNARPPQNGENPIAPSTMNVNPSNDLAATDNFKYGAGLTTTMENEFPRINNNIGIQDPFSSNKLGGKGTTSQKSLADKDSFNQMAQTAGGKTTSQQKVGSSFGNLPQGGNQLSDKNQKR